MSSARRLGHREVSPIGFGAMQLSETHRPDPDAAVQTLLAAFDAGCTLIDTADAYCLGPDEMGHNERLIARGLREWAGDPDSILVATKGGHTRRSDGSWDLDGRPEHLRQACEASLRNLGVEAIGLYQFHRPDPKVPFEESVGAIRELQQQGKVHLAGISNVDVAQIDAARSVLDVVSVQNEYSPWFTSSRPELTACEAAGIAFLCWAPLGGSGRAAQAAEALPSFAEIARDRGVSVPQVILAWELAEGEVVVPIPGTRRVGNLLDCLAAETLALGSDELDRLNADVGRLHTAPPEARPQEP